MAESRTGASRRTRVLRGMVAVLLLIPALAYGGACAYLYQRQRSLLFWAPTVARAELDRRAAEVGARVVDFEAEDGTRLYGWHRPSQGPSAGTRAVLFFHGSGETVFRTDLQNHLVGQGWDVFVPSYRGYPGSEGEPSEAGFILDARAAWQYVTGTLGISPDRVVVHGLSLGGGVATALAAEVEPAALVLESTFYSVPEAATERYPWFPVHWLIRDRFDSAARAPGIQVPVLVVHSVSDEVIPVAQARRLADAFPNARFVEVKPRPHGATLTVEVSAARDAYDALLARVSPVDSLR